jgi:hypothetical protein
MAKTERGRLREGLLSQQDVSSQRLDKYRTEVNMLLEQKERSVLLEKRVTSGAWVFLVVLSTAFIVLGGMRNDTLTGIWFGILACFWLVLGSTFLVRQQLNQRELVLFKELKGLELRVLELRKVVEDQGRS